MRSLIGRAAAWNISNLNPYVVYSYGVKEEAKQANAMFSSYELAYNALMQDLADLILQNQDKNLVWCRFPEVLEKIEFSPVDGRITKWYKGTMRLCFE